MEKIGFFFPVFHFQTRKAKVPILPRSFFLCATGLFSSWHSLGCVFPFTNTPCRQVRRSAATRTVSSLLVQYTMMESRQPKRSPRNSDTNACGETRRGGVGDGKPGRPLSRQPSPHLIFGSVRGHGQMQVWRHRGRSDGNAVLAVDVEVACDVQSGGERGRRCESQQAPHP